MKIALRKILKVLLFLYVAGFAIFLTGGAFSEGLTTTNIVTTLLFLPVTIHFILEAVRKAKSATTIRSQNYKPIYQFSLKSFFTQNDPTFAITIILLTVSLSLTFLRATGTISTYTPNISTIQESSIDTTGAR